MAQRWFGAESALLILSVLCVRAPAALANASITSSPIGPRTAGSRPVGTLFTSANSGSGSQVPVALLPAAADIPFAGRTLALELTPVYFGSDFSRVFHEQLWSMTASLAFPLSFDREHLGFFAEPKLLVVFQQSTKPIGTSWPLVLGRSIELSAGLHLGYRIAMGPISFAPLIGITAGRDFGRANPGLKYSVSLNLLRIGFRW